MPERLASLPGDRMTRCSRKRVFRPRRPSLRQSSTPGLDPKRKDRLRSRETDLLATAKARQLILAQSQQVPATHERAGSHFAPAFAHVPAPEFATAVPPRFLSDFCPLIYDFRPLTSDL